mmetsp:Transcript_15869/g.23899  ORF Transcript_15869/g.23899 Transcript_15869/m.23899 type:complete len:679 (+) Transcript_15869:171-2207(+)|eukprot:CAMPEP_0185038010 /NCGR_PEP_ID=MMETSP1103-20130426/33118_1 /TAXON_ID=36769 /ORGANISM="Paraphysomonas bandaiensis, Strain Caron Lab Isolate" /LENGTH=678 /DNA_ID=CAMNT_0027576251 /DNA_START=108 /DNA_END=2144 /DNA_ORIENTATION=-
MTDLLSDLDDLDSILNQPIDESSYSGSYDTSLNIDSEIDAIFEEIEREKSELLMRLNAAEERIRLEALGKSRASCSGDNSETAGSENLQQPSDCVEVSNDTVCADDTNEIDADTAAEDPIEAPTSCQENVTNSVVECAEGSIPQGTSSSTHALPSSISSSRKKSKKKKAVKCTPSAEPHKTSSDASNCAARASGVAPSSKSKDTDHGKSPRPGSASSTSIWVAAIGLVVILALCLYFDVPLLIHKKSQGEIMTAKSGLVEQEIKELNPPIEYDGSNQFDEIDLVDSDVANVQSSEPDTEASNSDYLESNESVTHDSVESDVSPECSDPPACTIQSDFAISHQSVLHDIDVVPNNLDGEYRNIVEDDMNRREGGGTFDDSFNGDLYIEDLGNCIGGSCDMDVERTTYTQTASIDDSLESLHTEDLGNCIGSSCDMEGERTTYSQTASIDDSLDEDSLSELYGNCMGDSCDASEKRKTTSRTLDENTPENLSPQEESENGMVSGIGAVVTGIAVCVGVVAVLYKPKNITSEDEEPPVPNTSNADKHVVDLAESAHNINRSLAPPATDNMRSKNSTPGRIQTSDGSVFESTRYNVGADGSIGPLRLPKGHGVNFEQQYVEKHTPRKEHPMGSSLLSPVVTNLFKGSMISSKAPDARRSPEPMCVDENMSLSVGVKAVSLME